MDVGALVVAIIALLVSGWSAYNTHRHRRAGERSASAAEASAPASRLSADSSAEVARVERHRRHEELAPELHVSYGGVLQRQGGVEYRGLVMGVEAQHRYSDVQAELLRSPQGTQEAATELFALESTFEVGRRISLGAVRGGDELRVGLRLRPREDDSLAGGRVRMLVSFRDDGGAEWPRVVHADVPGDPRIDSL